MGGGKARSSTKTGQAVLPFIERQVLPAFAPIQQLAMGQMAEALRTGGVNAQIPAIQSAVGQARSQLSAGLTDTESQLAGRNLLGTPYGQRILAEQRMRGLQAISQIPPQMAAAYTGGAPEMVTGLLTAMLGALTGASTTTARSGPFAV